LTLSVVVVDRVRMLVVSFVCSVLMFVAVLLMIRFDCPVVGRSANLLRRRKYCFSSSINGKNDEEEIYSEENFRNCWSINDDG